MKRDRSTILQAALLAAAIAGGSAQAADNFAGTVDGDWTKAGNWATGEYPTNENVTLEMEAFIDSEVPNDIWAFRLGASGDAVFNVLTGAVLTATSHTSWGSWLGMAAGYSGTVNQSGGDVTVNELEVGSQADAFGFYNQSGGTTTVSGALYDLSLYIGATKNAYKSGTLGGTGNYSMTGGSLLTRGGVLMGHPTISGEGTFEVWGTGPDQIGIGSYGTGFTSSWAQYSNSTLRVGIAADGITPIQINGGTSSNGTAFFADGSIIDVSFMDGYSEVGSWTVMECEGTMVNAGLKFPADMADKANWGFMVTNNNLMVGYGLGWPEGYPTNIVLPPSPGRTLYWTGNGQDTDSANAENWDLDTIGTPATWGIYSEDTLQIGDSAVLAVGEEAVVDYNGDAAFEGQNLLNIANERKGVLNMNSGNLTFTKSVNSRQQLGYGSETGDGTINLNGGSLNVNTLRVGQNGAKGTINVNSGAFTVARQKDTLDGITSSITLGFNAAGSGDFTISGGSLLTRGGILVGYAGAPSSFCVEGSAASSIQIGQENNTVDGAWVQYPTGTLKIRVDAGGVTPIVIKNSDNTNANGGDAYFKAGSLLDVGWVDGVENYGTFDVMTWGGQLQESDLAFTNTVDTSIWSFEFVDTNSDTTNDTLRITAYGETTNGTPYPWLAEHGLTSADDDVDNDGDGLLTWEEYVAGTNPTNAASVFAINNTKPMDADMVITWNSVEGKTYNVMTNANLTFPSKGTAAAGIIGQANETSYTSTVSGASTLFYEVEVNKQ